MKEFKAAGTLGDVYLICCKLMQISDGKRCKMFHFTKHIYWHDKIKEIYSMLPHVEVVFDVDSVKHDLRDVYEVTPYYKDYPIPNAVPYVRSHVDATKFGLYPYSYDVANIKSGRKDQGHRTIPNKELKKFINKKTVILGDDYDYKGKGVSLIGRTTMFEAFGIIDRCHQFYGFQGLLSFVALSMGKETTVYVKMQSDIDAINLRICDEWKKKLKVVYL